MRGRYQDNRSLRISVRGWPLLFVCALIGMWTGSAMSSIPSSPEVSRGADTVEQDVVRILKAVGVLGDDISGDQQVGRTGRVLARPLVVRVQGDEGRYLPDVLVRFDLIAGPGWGEEPSGPDQRRTWEAISDDEGYAKTHLVLGEDSGTYIITARAAQVASNEVVFKLIALPRGWGLLTFFGLAGGLAIFLFGLRFAGRGLTKATGNRLREMFWGFTHRRSLGLVVGTLATAILQSSTATTVMLVSFAGAGLITLVGALPIILGADIGTSLTVQLLAFRIGDYAILIIALSFLAMTVIGQRPYRHIAQAIFGFGLLFFGIKIMSDSIIYLPMLPGFERALGQIGEHPILLLVVAMVFSGLVHSSAATIGIALTLALRGLIDLNAAMPLILGANVGTCGTALLASLGQAVEARRVALAHVVFKVGIVVIALLAMAPFVAAVERTAQSVPRQIANAHLFLNLAAAAIFLPLLVPYRRMIERVLPEGPGRAGRFRVRYLDQRVLDTPVLALSQATREVLRMAEIVQGMFRDSIEVFRTGDEDLRKRIVEDDDKVDLLQESITPYLTRLSQEELTEEQSEREVALIKIVSELERIGDLISKQLMVYAQKKIKEGFYFSKEGFREIIDFQGQVEEGLSLAIGVLTTFDPALARRLIELRNPLHERFRELQAAHISRLCEGRKESLDTSTIHLDLLDDIERIGFHVTNIGSILLGRV